MDNVTICIIVVVVVLFLALIYIYRDLGDKIESLERERKEMETRLIDEISDLRKVATKASVASAAATAAATAASLSAKSTREGLAFAASGGAHRGTQGPAPGAALRAVGQSALPAGIRAAINSAQEKGLSQDHHTVSEKLYDPKEGKTVSPATAAAMAPKNRAPAPDGSGMVEAPMPQVPDAAPAIPQIFGPAAAPTPAAIPGINYEAIAQGFATDQDFAVDAFDFSLGDPSAEFALNY